MRLQAQGITLEQYLEATGQDQETFVDELRETAAQGVKVDLALRAVAEAEGIEVDDEDLEAEFAAVAERVGQKPEQVRKQFERNEQCRWYAPTSGSARPSNGCSSRSRSSTSRATADRPGDDARGRRRRRRGADAMPTTPPTPPDGRRRRSTDPSEPSDRAEHEDE